MDNVTKFPDMRPPKGRGAPIAPLPGLSEFQRSAPLFPTSDDHIENRRAEIKRRLMWFGVAVAFHAALFVGWWLTPALRLHWDPSPDAWVHVTSIPQKPLVAPAVPVSTP